MGRQQDLGNQSLENNANWQTLIDEADTSTTYVGKAKHDVLSSQAKWQIKKISITGTVTSIKFAEGDDTFERIWDNRTTYTY